MVWEAYGNLCPTIGGLQKSRIDGLIWGQMISRQIDGPRNAGKSHLVEHLHLNDLERRPKTIQMEKVPKRRILYTMVSQHSHEKSTVWMVFTRGIFNSELFVYRRVFQMNHFQLYLRKKPLYIPLLRLYLQKVTLQILAQKVQSQSRKPFLIPTNTALKCGLMCLLRGYGLKFQNSWYRFLSPAFLNHKIVYKHG